MSHEHGHHKETFITKYIFSIDHKMIAKQYLITGLLMGIVGVVLSLFFRMQIAWPEESFEIFKIFFTLLKENCITVLSRRGIQTTGIK